MLNNRLYNASPVGSFPDVMTVDQLDLNEGKRPTRVPRPKRHEVRQRVIDGAFEAFAERGFMGASVDFICSKAGLSRGAFYSNFRDKDELFIALYDQQAGFLTSRIRRSAIALTQSDSPLATLAALIGEPDRDERRWDIINKEFVIHALRNPSARFKLNDRRAHLRRDIAAVLENVFETLGRPVPNDIDEYARIAIAIYEGNATQRGLEPERTAEHSLLARFLPTILQHG